MIIQLPKYVQIILNTLENAGFVSYVVGGCVRDSILKREVADWDITTSATADQIEALFQKTFALGKKFGTITVVMGKNQSEVTTFRRDGAYKNNRHPEGVTFSLSIDEDCKRRDFTVNAMAYSPKWGFIDHFNGIEDLQNKLIRAVGNPTERFNEDALRILRAYRFSAKLGFEIEGNTLKAIKSCANLVQNISKERIKAELDQILENKKPNTIFALLETKALSHILPVKADNLPDLEKQSPRLRFKLLLFFLFDGEKSAIKKALKELRCENNVKKDFNNFLKGMELQLPQTEYEMRKILSEIGSQNTKAVLFIQKALLKIHIGKQLALLDRVKNNPISMKQLAINGEDLKELGIKGEKIGETLKYLLDKVLENPKLNEKSALTHIAKEKENIIF
jgi:tRNA nucleotidyltransferase (CCA-adding enzyme)